MTEDDIRLAMKLFGGTGYNDPLSQYNRSREIPKPAPKRKSALDAARFSTLGRGTQPQIGLEPEFRDIDLKQREATIAGLSPLENLQAFGEGARTVGQAAVAGITQPFAELMGVPADKFYKAAIDLPESPGGLARGEQMIEGVQDFFGAMSESPLAPIVEKIPFSPYSPASAQAIDTGLAQAGKGLKMAGQQAKQAGRQTLEAGKDLAQAARTEFATPPTGAVQLQTQQAPRNPLGMYSQAEQVALNLPQQKGTGNQFLAQISKAPGVKPAELEWTGLADFLKSKGDQPVTKQEIQQYLDANRVQVEAVQLSGKVPYNRVRTVEDQIPEGFHYEEVLDRDGEPTGMMRIYDSDGDLVSESSDPEQLMRRAGLKYEETEPDAKYGEWQLPGGYNYREVLLTLPEQKSPYGKFLDYVKEKYGKNTPRSQWSDEDNKTYEKLTIQQAAAGNPNFQSTHFNQPNILAHMRLNDRVDANGDKVLFVEEMQSDWGQKGKKKGFTPKGQTKYGPEFLATSKDGRQFDFYDADRAQEWLDSQGGGELKKIPLRDTLPSAPFVTNTEDWVNLSLKRLITDAVNNGYKKVAFINGDQSAARYDLSKHVDKVSYFPSTKTIVAYKGGNSVVEKRITDPKELEEVIGKDAANKLLERPTEKIVNARGDEVQSLSGVDLKVGGEGMKKFYDQIVPATANKLLKKLGGGKLEPIEVGAPIETELSITDMLKDLNISEQKWLDMPWEEKSKLMDDFAAQNKQRKMTQLGFTITPEMVELVKKQGLPMFAAGGAVTMKTGGNPLKAAREGMQAAKKAMKAQRREERVQKNLEAYMGSKEKPKTYYHATQAPEDFEAFDLEKRPTKRSAAAVFVTPSTDWASDWAKDELVGMDVLEKVDTPKPRIMPVITRAKNTFDYENPEHVERVMSQAKLPESLDRQHVADQISTGNWNFIEDRNIQQAIKDLGFDSFNIKEKGVKNMGIFNPGDVKALFNRGSYDPTTADISKADGGRISADDIRQKLKNAFNFAGGGKVESQPEEPKIAGGGMASKSLLERLRAYKKGGEVRMAIGGDAAKRVKAGFAAAKKGMKTQAQDDKKPAYSEKVLQSTTERMATQIQKENPKMSAEDVLKKAQAQAKKKLTWEREEKPELEKTYGELKKAPYSASLPERKQNVPAVVQQRIEETERFLAQPTEPWEPPRKELQAFDRERIKDALEGFPGVEQTRFPRYQAPRSGALGMMEEIYQDPVNRRLIEGQIKRGLPLGGETFYASLYPLKLAALERGIPEQQFNQFVYSIAPASARNSIMNEMAVGQFLRDMNARGLPLDEETVRKEMDRFKAQYGTGLPLMPVHREGVKNVLEGNLDLREMSKADIPTSYKIPTYGTQKAGDFAQSMVLDVHEAAGQTRGSKYHPYFTEQGGFSQPEYGPAESEMLDIAQGLGIPGGMAQAGRWFGGGELTGLKSPRGDALDLLERQAAYTLQGQGINPTPRAIRNFVLDMVETGRGELMPYFKKTPMPDYRTEKKKGGLATLKG